MENIHGSYLACPRPSSFSISIVQFPDSTIIIWYHRCDLFRKVARRKTLSLCKDGSSTLGLQCCIWTNHKICGTMLFRQTKPKWRCLAIMHSVMFGKKPNTAYQYKHIILNVKHSGGFRLVLQPQYVGTLQSLSCPQILCIPRYSRVKCVDIWPTKLGWNRAVQPDNKISTSIREWLRKKKMKVSQYPSQGPDLNLIEGWLGSGAVHM